MKRGFEVVPYTSGTGAQAPPDSQAYPIHLTPKVAQLQPAGSRTARGSCSSLRRWRWCIWCLGCMWCWECSSAYARRAIPSV